jgi:hypothetical protein
LPDIADSAFDFSFFPGRRDMTGAWDEVVFPREGEEARVEAHQVGFVFSDDSGEIVVPQFTRNPTHRVKRVDVTTDEGFECLALREFQVEFSAVALHQRKRVELARRTVVDQ